MTTLNLFGLSGGKDSTALLGWALHESGYPRESLRFSFADTQNEYEEVYDQIRKLSAIVERAGCYPVVWLRPVGFLEMCKEAKRFPSPVGRFCTRILKMEPLCRLVEGYQLDGYNIVSHSGVRASESTERSLMPEWEDVPALKGRSGLGWGGVKIRRPLLTWTIDDVWNAHKKWKLPINALYGRGRSRVGCRLCVMSKKEDVRVTVRHFPETIDLIREWESKVREASTGGATASFFPPNFIPKSMCSLDGVTSEGCPVKIATIDDVARWAFTVRGGVQGGFDFMFEEDDSHAPCQSGYCE